MPHLGAGVTRPQDTPFKEGAKTGGTVDNTHREPTTPWENWGAISLWPDVGDVGAIVKGSPN